MGDNLVTEQESKFDAAKSRAFSYAYKTGKIKCNFFKMKENEWVYEVGEITIEEHNRIFPNSKI